MNARFKMQEVKKWLMTNYELRANAFSGSWEVLQDGSNYGRPITLEDQYEIADAAKKVFPGLTVGAIKCITDKVWNTDFLADWGMANGLSYTSRFRIENIALFFAAGERFSEPRHIIRRACGPDVYETKIDWCNDDKLIEAVNKYLSIHRLPPISAQDLGTAPFIYREKHYTRNYN